MIDATTKLWNPAYNSPFHIAVPKDPSTCFVAATSLMPACPSDNPGINNAIRQTKIIIVIIVDAFLTSPAPNIVRTKNIAPVIIQPM